MGKWVVDIHGDIEGDYEIIRKYEEPKTGRWIKNEEHNGWETILTDCCCSVCGEKALLKRLYSMDGESIVFHPSNYCPNCGAKMEE